MVQTLREEATQIEKVEFLRQLSPMQSATKGQIISKRLFDVFKFFQKNERKHVTLL